MAEEQNTTDSKSADSWFRDVETFFLNRSRPLIAGLKPEFRQQYDKKIQELGREIPLEVHDSDGPESQIAEFKEGSLGGVVYKVPISAIIWTPDLARVTSTDDKAIDLLYFKADEADEQKINVAAKYYGLPTIKLLLVVDGGSLKEGVFQSAQGQIYMALKRSTLENDDLLAGVLAHEFGHIAKKHTSFEEKAALYNLPPDQRIVRQRQKEDEVDMYAVQHCAGPQLARGLSAAYENLKTTMQQRSKTPEEYRQKLAEYEAQDDHSHPDHRVGNILKAHLKAVAAGQCKSQEVEMPEQAPQTPHQKPVAKGPLLP